MHKRSTILEAHEARNQIISCLTVDGFSDIGEEDVIILLALAEDLTTQVIADLASDLGMSGQAIAGSSAKLLSRGYLELKREPDKPGPPRIAATQQGMNVCNTIQYAIHAKRWADLPVRHGDIVISTAPKSGTTWLQMICALLIFQSPDLPAPLQQLSPWLEWLGRTRDDVFAELAAQNHRRFLKTHMGLNEISIDSRVSYIVVGRHPLDAMLSYLNINSAPRDGDDVPAFSAALQPSDVLREWIDQEAPTKRQNLASVLDFTLPGVMKHLSDAWQRRNEPNVLLVHYDDLSEDLEGEMRRIATTLGITVPETAWSDLVKAATFEDMRASADRLQPFHDLADPKVFFRSGKSGRGSELLTSQALAHYRERIAQLAPADLVAWLHRDLSVQS